MSLLVLLYKAHTLFFLFWFLATTAHHTGWLLPQPSVFQKISEFFPLYLIQPQVPLSISSLQTPSHCVYLTVSFDILIFYQTLRLPFPSFWQCFVSSSDLLSPCSFIVRYSKSMQIQHSDHSIVQSPMYRSPFFSKISHSPFGAFVL